MSKKRKNSETEPQPSALARPQRADAGLLADYWRRAERKLEDQYRGALTRHAGDAGTRGDQGEEDWAEILRSWLPPRFRVMTKGRIVGDRSFSGGVEISPQIDVVVLHPDYPPALENEKLYLIDGIVAAFECKTRVKTRHVREAVEFAKKLAGLRTRKSLARTPREWLAHPVLFGLLGHTHSWQSESPGPRRALTRSLYDAHQETVEEAIDMIDLVCVADLGFWSSSKTLMRGDDRFPSGDVKAGYLLHQAPTPDGEGPFQTNIGRLVAAIWAHIATYDPAASRLGFTARRANATGAQGPVFDFPEGVPDFIVAKYREMGWEGPDYPPGWELGL